MTLGPQVRRYVRYAEAAIVVALLGWASLTYRELSALRRHPVALPTYNFETSASGDLVKAQIDAIAGEAEAMRVYIQSA